MKKLSCFLLERWLGLAALFFAMGGVAQAAVPVSPEPADYAVGFGAATLVFVIWRNIRKSRRADRGAAE